MTEPLALPSLTNASPVTTYHWTRLDGQEVRPDSGQVVEEVPVAFIYGARAHVVVMATPADLEDLAVGFSVTEGIVASAGEIDGVRVERHARGVELRIGVPSGVADRLRERARAMPARTGCGLCGVEAIDDAVRPARRVAGALTVAPEALFAAARALGSRQALNREAYALHAAAWATPDGDVVLVREDVGRHNALDKVIGALLRAGEDPSRGLLIVTSRASVELVQKAAAVGVPLLAAVSRPTALAIRMAEACGMALVGLVRGDTANVYAGAHRVRAAVAAGA